MKKFVFIFTCLILLVSISGCESLARMDSSIANEPFTYIYDFPAMDENEIFTTSRLWVAETYNSAESVMTFDDADTGVIKGTGVGTVRADLGILRDFKYNLSVEVKDKKARIQFSNIRPSTRYAGGTSTPGVDTTYVYGYNAIKEYFDNLAPTYREFLLREPEDW